MRPLASIVSFCVLGIACSVPAPATDDDGSDGSAGKGGTTGGSGASGAGTSSGGAGSAGKATTGGTSSGGTSTGGTSAQAGAGGEPFGGGGAAGSAQAGGSQAGSGQGGSAMVCTPGQQVACACPGGQQGAQACNANGTGYEACDCPSGTGGSTGTGGAAGTGGTPAAGTGGSAMVDPIGNAEKCPGADVAFTGNSVVVSGTTKGAAGDYDPIKCASAKSSEVVYKIVAPKTGTLTATVVPTGFDAVIYWSDTTCSGDLPKACSASGGGYGEPETIDIATTSGTTYWIFVDGWTQGFSGSFDLTLGY